MYNASIIIPVDNSYALLDNFFNSLFTSIDKSKYEIIVVDDNCEKHSSLEYLEKLKSRSLIDKLIHLKEKGGYSHANNIGIEQATSERIILSNSDIIFMQGVLDELVNTLDDSRNGAVQPMLLYPQTSRIQSTGHIFGNLFNRHAFAEEKLEYTNLDEVICRQALTTALCATTKKIFLEAGGFDEQYYNGYEGLELTLKIGKSHRCIVRTDIYAYHIRSVAVTESTFDEEQKIPLFWDRCKNMIYNDYKLLIEERIKDVYSPACSYSVIDFCVLDLYREIQTLPIQISSYVRHMYLPKVTIELFSVLPFMYTKTATPLIFLCDNYKQLENNHLWFCIRNCTRDIIIDSNGNVISPTRFADQS